jgi:cell wall-associated NlpC family hydrolase
VPLADQALFGELVTVLPAPAVCTLPGGRRVLVKTAAPYSGYADVESLLPWPEPTAPYRSGVLRRVESRFANVYPQPDLTRSNPLLVLPLGVQVRQERVVSPRWIELVLPDGRHGFVQQGDLDAGASAPATATATTTATATAGAVADCVIAHALAHEGSPYLWGGRSTYGIDCSGLVASSYGACGVTVPRDARQQFAWDGLRPGPAPAKESVGELRPGDLLFFTSPDAPPPSAGARRPITHVGVYLGDGRFVHASTSERPSVHQSQLRDEEWQRRWVGTRRYVESSP